ncbi:hypothetical protein ACFYE2_16655 [Kocuria sp. CPCC 205300]|uniref:hypothetical protein n=1 Tax=Kocuria sabuli TaxID=3071448 RepID=UPI0036D88561
MTTPLVPEVPRLPGAAASAAPAGGGHRRSADRTAERSPVPALLLLLGLALVLAARAVPVASLATVTVLLLVAVAALARDTAPGADTSPAAGTPARGGTTCRLEDASDTLRCHRPAGHTGTHYDARAGRVFRDTLVDRIGDAGAYYLDRQGRPVPVGDAF